MPRTREAVKAFALSSWGSFRVINANNQNKRKAASASSAKIDTVRKNFDDCPWNRLSLVRAVTAACAPANRSLVGRITAQCGKFGLMNSQGTGKIRLG